MARVYPICSSSKGNCVFVGTRGKGILIDVGCSFKVLKNSLALIDTDLSGIEAVFITHEHSDHIQGLPMLMKNTNIPVFATKGTEYALRNSEKIPDKAVIYNSNDGYQSVEFEVECFPTSHDASESVGYKVKYASMQFGLCTDTGYVTDSIRKALIGCDVAYIESNYDEDMLRRNLNYSAMLKTRILSDRGHLSNVACSEFATELVKSGTRHIILGHLSENNNSPQMAKSCVNRALNAIGLREERDYTLNVAPVATTGEFVAF